MLNFDHIDADTRDLMQEIWHQDTYHPANLTTVGVARYRDAVLRHVQSGDVNSLYREVASFEPLYTKGDKRGVLPNDWARRLVQTDYLSLWNCARAKQLIAEGETHGVIVRVGTSYIPRGECEQLEHLAVPLDAVANCFRAKYHPAYNRNAFSVPVGPNCHHGIRRLTDQEKSRPFFERSVNGIVYRDYGI
jgi:hypothetical protein